MDRKFRKFSKRSSKPPKEETKKIEAEIESLVWGGKGLSRVGGKVFFVSKSAPLDRAVITVTKEKSDYGEGEIEKILYPSPFRVAPPCPHFKKCGGCQFLHIGYQKQVQEKERIAREVLRRWTGEALLKPILPSPSPLEYRHSGDFHVFFDRGALKVGFYEAESHKIVPFDRCFLFSAEYNRTLAEIKAVLGSSPWKEKLFKLNLSASEKPGEFVLVVSLKEKNERAGRALINELKPVNLKGVLVLGTKENEEVCRAGDISLSYSLASERKLFGAATLKYDPRSFTQADYGMNRAIVEDVAEMMNLSRHERVLELYSGVGNFTLPLAGLCKEIVAVESSGTAVADAKENAAASGAENIQHVEGDVAEWTMKLIGKSASFDAILLDPPRSGAFEIVYSLASLTPGRLVYVSCSLPTLDRDLRKFGELGFKPKEFRFYDLFPQTYNMETAVLLAREK